MVRQKNTTINTISVRPKFVRANPYIEKKHGVITLDEILKRVSKLEEDHIQLSKKVDGI